MNVAVLSANMGGYDEPRRWPLQTVDHERVIVTDSPAVVEHAAADGEVDRCVFERRPHLHPRMAAKIPKCLPFEYTDADTVIWVDGSVQPTSEHFVQWMLANSSGPLSMFTHPLRTRITDEATASDWMAKYQGQDVHGQVAHYLADGHPDDFGLWATGLAVHRRTNSAVWSHSEFGESWLAEQVRWTYQDQLSLPVVARRMDVRPRVIPGSLFSPEGMHFTLNAHRRDD